MGRVDGKVALVTGGASGLGKADCRRLAEEGAKIVVADIDVAGAQALAAELGDKAIAVKLDVSSPDDWQAAIAKTAEAFGGLNILVNNAGIVVVADPEETTIEQFRKVQAVMSEGVFLGVKYALPLMAKSGAGSIINMSSTASHLGYPPFFAYSAAKGAVRSMTKSIAMHCQQKGYPIRCNSVHPASIETPMIQGAMGRPGEEHEVPDGVLPAGSIGAPKDVANLILYLASDESRFVTGAEILIDNGLTITPAG
ncbi:glucose 1-dehydrogenase [Sphingomonas jaspsi]|uniref:glucose 1-dehydrogenase n=1 Tax=Sphingomonas jaspsi TaxID=392409 RepID=UPI0004B204AE|nr:glucose 1-dehydrogenase [Sphingomonas jaspsi]